MPQHALDIITIGRSSVDLYGQQIGGRLEDMGSFAKYVGGSPTNTAIGGARLGLAAAVITGVGDEHMGRFIIEQLRRDNVDTCGVKVDPDRLTALVILGIRDKQSFPLIFYRENCADMGLREADIDPEFIARTGTVVISGTHFSTPEVSAMSSKAANLCRKNGGRVAFDIDYRPNLWGLGGHGDGQERFASDDKVTEHLQSILPLCDLIVGTEEEIHIAGGTTDTLRALERMRSLTGAVLVCKRGPMGCVSFPGEIPTDIEDGIKGPGFPVDVFNVLGAGDAFMGGYLRGWVRNEPFEICAQYANACGAMAVSRHGCAPAVPDWSELQYFLRNGSACFELRKDPDLNHRHWAATRRNDRQTVMALAIDHRSQFVEMAEQAGAPLDRIGNFKLLALSAIRRVADGRPGFGTLLDDRFGQQALHAAMEGDLWVGRPVEVPGSRPVQFEPGPDIGSALAEWPVDQVVKCLLFYHPDDPEELKSQQEEQAIQLAAACRSTGHELLLEIIASKHGPIEADTTARVLSCFYDLGVKPDWWKLEPQTNADAWQRITDTIGVNDPFCRGIVLLGLDAPMEQLLASFESAARYGLVKGFTIGRSIFGDAARAWFAGTITDEEAQVQMCARFERLCEAWMNLRPEPGAGMEA